MKEIHTEKSYPNRVSAPVFLQNLTTTNPTFFFLADYFLKGEKKVGRYFLNYLRREAHELEGILDEAEVFTNKLFFFRELMAGIRWFCRAAFTLEEGVLSRYAVRRLKESAAEKEKMQKECEKTLAFLYEGCSNFCAEALKIVTSYGVVIPRQGKAESYIKLHGQVRLEKNRLISSVATPLDAVETLCIEFVAISEDLGRFQERIHQKRETINEKTVAHILSGFHRLESFYDTHLHDTELERGEPDFWSMRGYIAMALRFSEVLQSLVHFYERHLLATKDPVVRQNFERLINEECLLSAIIEFALKWTVYYSQSGTKLALELLTRSTGKVRRTIRIPVGVDGIHARPMTWIYKTSQRYGGKVIFEVGGEKFEADSMLSMLTMTEAIDRSIGLTDREGQIAVAAGTIINELKERHKPIKIDGKVYSTGDLIVALEAFRAELRDKAGTRFVEVVVTGPQQAVADIEIMANNYFKPEALPPHISSYLFGENRAAP